MHKFNINVIFNISLPAFSYSITNIMDQLPDMETVYAALDALYGYSNSTSKEEASKWLTELQESVHGWQIASTLLQEKKNIESCFFAAQTLKTKTENAFHELSTESCQLLRDYVLEILKQGNENPSSMFFRELGIVVINLLMRMRNWDEPIQDLIGKLHVPGSRCSTSLLGVLTLLPEELESSTLNLEAGRKRELFDHLAASTQDVLGLLNSSAFRATVNGKTNSGLQVIKCFGSWIHLPCITVTQLDNSAVLGYAFDKLASSECNLLLHESAADLICDVIGVVAFRQKDTFSAELTCFTNTLIKNILNLGAAYLSSVDEEDSGKAIDYCRIFTALGEAMLPCILNLVDQGKSNCLLGVLDLISLCIGHQDYEVVQITFGFWHKLSENLNGSSCIPKFRHYINRLLFNLHRHCHLEKTNYNNSSDFFEFRVRVEDLVRDLVFIIDPASVFKYYSFMINVDPNVSWQVTEASLFMMKVVAEHLVPCQPKDPMNDHVRSVVETSLIMIETANTPVASVSLILLQSLGKWMMHSLKNECDGIALLERVLGCVNRAMWNSSLSLTAARSFASICTLCARYLTPHFDTLLQAVESLASLPKISRPVGSEIVQAVTRVWNYLPPHRASDGLRRLCETQVKELTQICQNPHTKMSPIRQLDRLSSIFCSASNMYVDSVVQVDYSSIVAHAEPVLLMTLTMFLKQKRVVAHACKCIRNALQLCLNQFALPPLSEPLITTIMEIYPVTHYSSFLQLASVIVKTYGDQNHYIARLMDLVNALAAYAFQLLLSSQGFQRHLSTGEFLFELLNCAMIYSPGSLAHYPALPTIVDCATQMCSLNDLGAKASAQKFLANLAMITLVNNKVSDKPAESTPERVFHLQLPSRA